MIVPEMVEVVEAGTLIGNDCDPVVMEEEHIDDEDKTIVDARTTGGVEDDTEQEDGEITLLQVVDGAVVESDLVILVFVDDAQFEETLGVLMDEMLLLLLLERF